MIFELGKYYKNQNEKLIHILCEVSSTIYGDVFIGEDLYKGFSEYDKKETIVTKKYVEISKVEWDEEIKRRYPFL